jgi:hypothetical protein
MKSGVFGAFLSIKWLFFASEVYSLVHLGILQTAHFITIAPKNNRLEGRFFGGRGGVIIGYKPVASPTK